VRDVVAGGMIAQGSRVAQLERKIAEYDGSAGSVATASGTAALTIALRALDVAGAEVIVPTYVCGSVADAVAAAGARVAYCDVSESWIMTAESVAPFMTARTRAIVVVHLFGVTADTDSLARFGLPVIDDYCQAFGAPRLGVGADLRVYSFHATKCLTTGEGGAVSARDPDILGRMRALAGRSAPLSDLQAALGLSQLGRYDAFLRERATQADEYFSEIPRAVTERLASLRRRSMFFRFPLRIAAAGDVFDDARRFFGEAGIAVRRGVDTLLHRQTSLGDDRFPGAVRCYEETLSIPLRPGLTPAERERIICRVREYVGR
jgi:UDP-4-amino-4-deoxy-L-arabinose-oxoglutarate aminotransferase